MTQTEVSLIERDADGIDPAFRKDVLNGLAQRQKAVPARWFYDFRGSELFERITALPEYYPTRVETGLLEQYGAEFARLAGPGRAIVEFGSGSSTKTPLLLRVAAPAVYVPIDISGDFLRQSNAELACQLPHLAIIPVEANFMSPVRLPEAVRSLPKLGFFPGSTIGNLTPASAVNLLRSMRATLGDDGQLLIGFDRVKDEARLVAAYDDAQGVTAQFNLNLLERINRELGSDIPVLHFRHRARWNPAWKRIEMHLEAQRDLSFTIAGERFAMMRGETIHTENSHKYTPDMAHLLLFAGGWTPLATFVDATDDFLLVHAEATEWRMAP
jgi:dimethylhistidine N-methyltransferase